MCLLHIFTTWATLVFTTKKTLWGEGFTILLVYSKPLIFLQIKILEWQRF
jgi:hypothetical protein